MGSTGRRRSRMSPSFWTKRTSSPRPCFQSSPSVLGLEVKGSGNEHKLYRFATQQRFLLLSSAILSSKNSTSCAVQTARTHLRAIQRAGRARVHRGFQCVLLLEEVRADGGAFNFKRQLPEGLKTAPRVVAVRRELSVNTTIILQQILLKSPWFLASPYVSDSWTATFCGVPATTIAAM